MPRNMCSAKASYQVLGFQSQAYVGILRAVKSKSVDGKFGEYTLRSTKDKKEEIPKDIWKIYGEYLLVFSEDLPKGVPPNKSGIN